MVVGIVVDGMSEESDVEGVGSRVTDGVGDGDGVGVGDGNGVEAEGEGTVVEVGARLVTIGVDSGAEDVLGGGEEGGIVEGGGELGGGELGGEVGGTEVSTTGGGDEIVGGAGVVGGAVVGGDDMVVGGAAEVVGGRVGSAVEIVGTVALMDGGGAEVLGGTLGAGVETGGAEGTGDDTPGDVTRIRESVDRSMSLERTRERATWRRGRRDGEGADAGVRSGRGSGERDFARN